MEQLLCHVFGDYILQSDYLALNKSKKSFPCLVHVLIYTSVFLLLTTSWKALLVIGATHFVLDRWHTPLKRLIWLKNHFPTGKYPTFERCDTTGYYDDSPYNTSEINGGYIDDNRIETVRKFGRPRLFFITMWLYIITDNFLHITINYFALKYLA